jgi:hypothetical protein
LGNSITNYQANYAATLTGFGQNEKALKILEELPNETGEFSFPYIRLVHVLKTTDNPLYEYWLQRARRQFPKAPYVARSYCHWLIQQNRLEELAEADWIDDLEHLPDTRVMGRGKDDPRLIVEIQVLQMIAQSLANEEIAPLENALKVLTAANKAWHMCVPAEQIAIAAQFFGRRDLVWQASRSFCSNCAKGRLGPITLQTLLANSAQVAGNSNQALQDAEIGLKHDPDNLPLRNTYWWSLDEVGRSDEALEVSKEL